MGHHVENAGSPAIVGDPQGRHELSMGREDRGYHVATDDQEHMLPADVATLHAAVQAQNHGAVLAVMQSGPHSSWWDRLCDVVLSHGDAADPLGVAGLWMTARLRHPL